MIDVKQYGRQWWKIIYLENMYCVHVSLQFLKIIVLAEVLPIAIQIRVSWIHCSEIPFIHPKRIISIIHLSTSWVGVEAPKCSKTNEHQNVKALTFFKNHWNCYNAQYRLESLKLFSIDNYRCFTERLRNKMVSVVSHHQRIPFSDALVFKTLKLWKMEKTQNHHFPMSMGNLPLMISMPVAGAKAFSMIAFHVHELGFQMSFRQNFLLWFYYITFNSKNIKSQHFFLLGGQWNRILIGRYLRMSTSIHPHP